MFYSLLRYLQYSFFVLFLVVCNTATANLPSSKNDILSPNAPFISSLSPDFQSLTPIFPLTPIEKYKKKKRKQSKRFRNKTNQPNINEPDILSNPWLHFLVTGTFFTGLILFCIGFPLGIFWLWLLGAILLGLHFGGFTLFALIAPFTLKPRDEKTYTLLWIMVAIGTIIVSLLIAGIAALIIGLLMSLSWMWIGSIVALVLGILLGAFMIGRIA